MKNFINSENNSLWAFEDDVVAEETDGVWKFFSSEGQLLQSVPSTLKLIEISADEAIANARNVKVAELNFAYQADSQKHIVFGGTQFQADFGSQSTLSQIVSAGTLPNGFYWVDIKNVKNFFSIDALRDLATLMVQQNWSAFQNLQNKKELVREAQTIKAIQAVEWK